MIGLILTGHGQFAVGVGQALEMIAGKQAAYRVVPFLESDPMDALENNLRNAMAELQEETEGIVVFADLLGGSPFKAAMLASVVILGIYYFFSRKNMKRQQQYFEKLHEALQVGKRVVCANGLYGTVKKVDEEKVDVEIAKGVVITVSRFAISEVL